MTPSDIAATFQKRRRTWLWVSSVCAVMFSTSIYFLSGVSGFLMSLSVTGMAGSLCIWCIFTLSFYHCPNCSGVPIEFYGRGGILLDPDNCPHCKAVLKPENL